MDPIGIVLALGSSLGPSAHSQSLDQQERCAQQARNSFQELEAQYSVERKRVGMAHLSGDYQSHYNKKLGKCLMLVESTDMLDGQSSTTAFVIDANERRP